MSTMTTAQPTERLISADSHVKVTHEQIKANLEPQFHQAYDDAVRAFGERMARGAGAANAAGAAMKAADKNAAFNQPGYWDPIARLEDMDRDGVDAEVLYSEVSAFRYLADMKEGQSESVRAFNDVLAAFAEPDPKRLIVSYQIPIHDIDIAIAEVKRVVGMGAKSLQLPVFPSEFGLPEYFDARYEPLLELIQETGLPICCHIGLNTNLDDLMRRDPTPNKGVMVPVTGLLTAEAFGMWIMGGVFEKFPRLNVVFVEPGLTWVVWWLHLVDDMVLRQGYEFPVLEGELPSFYYHRNLAMTFIDEPDPVRNLRHVLGAQNLLWSSDYPHPVSTWPKSLAVIEETFEGVPYDERDLMVEGNAARIWNL
jgi:uncharacterized protein